MATSTKRLAGIASFTIDGSFYDVKGSIEYSPATVTREDMIGQTGPVGYKEMPVFGHIRATLFDEGGISVADFNAMTAVTIQIQAANGKTIIGTDMFAVEAQTSNTEEGEFEVEWHGPSVIEILAQ